MPRILRILNRFNLGGPVLNAAYLTKYLQPEFTTLLVGGPPESYEGNAIIKVQDMGIEPRVIPSMNRSVHPLRDFTTFREISRIIDEFKPDIIHTHASKAGAVGRLAAQKKKVKVRVHTFHGHVFHSYFSSVKTSIYINLEKYLARETSKIIALSQKQHKELAETYKIAGKEKFRVIPLGFDLSRFRVDYQVRRTLFREQYGIHDDEIAIGVIGRLTPIKNHQLFLRAIARMKKTMGRKVRAFIIGDGELKEKLFAVCRQNQLKYTASTDYGNHDGHYTDVVFTSWVESIELVYPGLDIVALCSLNEGTPVSIIEAQACGTPVVAVDVGGIADIVQSGKTALLAKKDCLEDFSQKLIHLAESDHVRRDMAAHGWNHVASTFHHHQLAEQTGGLYRELLAANSID